ARRDAVGGRVLARHQLLDRYGPALGPMRRPPAPRPQLRRRDHSARSAAGSASLSISSARASERFSTPSLAKHDGRWLLTVPVDTVRRVAISLVVEPSAASARTSRSRGERAGGSSRSRIDSGTVTSPAHAARTARARPVSIWVAAP